MSDNLASITYINTAATQSVSTYSPARARTREAVMAELRTYYQDAFGLRCPPVARADMEWFLDAGIAPDVIRLCIDAATLAPRPSWAYARAILRRLRAEGVRTVDQYNKRQSDWMERTGRFDYL